MYLMRACPALTTRPLHMTDYSGGGVIANRCAAALISWDEDNTNFMRLERIWAQLEMPASQSTLASLKTTLEPQ
jgi:hypothetical protein